MSYYGRLMDAHLVAQTAVHLRRVPRFPHASDDRGWVTHRVVAVRADVELGHISVTHVPVTTYEEMLADPEAFCRIIEGRHSPTTEELRRAREHQRKFRAFHVDSAHVAYVHVDPTHRGAGIARNLYLEAARWMGEQGLVLAASDLQQPEAKRLWEALVGDPDVPTTKLPDGRPALDFT